ncbi:MAG: ATP-binding protein [Deltaproteobacteria bacterium]|nr:ATP-binding protein [Deltaproteobacteria bacterium]
MASDQLLNEIERQQKYLDALPENFPFPLFNTKRAVESQRQNGYRNTAAAAREIVDNAFEAGATKVHIITEEKQNNTRKIVSSVAFIDNGSGMLPNMARFALSWGGGTHFDDANFIGKFGFGLPNASINQTRLTEVYTRTRKQDSITKAWLNLDDYDDYTLQSIPEPTIGDLPDFVKRYMKKEGLNFDQGTVVVWVNPDRLTYKVPSRLTEHLVDDFCTTYRYLLDNRELKINGTVVMPVDPLFLDPRGRYYLPPEQGGAMDVLEGGRTLAVKCFRDQLTGALRLEKITDLAQVDRDDPNLINVGTFHLRVTRLPYGFAVGGRHSKDFSEEAKKRFEIRQSRRGMSFVRAGREIETFDAFPRSSRDRANGLGEWPLLQAYAYHWGVEVRFNPDLDEVFGIANDKQRVRPMEDFWRVLAEENIDALLRRENAWQSKTRAEEERKRRLEQARPMDTPTPAEEAVAAVPIITGKKARIPDRLKPVARKRAEEEVKKRAEVSEHSIDDVRMALEEESQRRPFRIDFFDDLYGPFYKPDWVGTQTVVWVNRQHPFFAMCYSELLNLTGGYKAKEALDVFLLTLAKAELQIDEELAAQQFQYQREQVWTRELAVALQNLVNKVQPPDEPEEGNEATAA